MLVIKSIDYPLSYAVLYGARANGGVTVSLDWYVPVPAHAGAGAIIPKSSSYRVAS